MKRFTETGKWRDPWYRKLSSRAKLLWGWLTDNCDNAGVIDLDLESASFDIGETIEPNHVAELESRLERLKSGKYWIVKFIPFQYGKLSPNCTPHIRVIELLQAHGIDYPTNTQPSTTLVPTILHKGSPPLGRVVTTLQDKTRQEEDKEEDKKGGAGGDGGWGTLGIIRERLNRMFGRKPTDPWSYEDEHALATVCRRPDAVFELGEIQKFKDSLPPADAKFSGFPKTLGKLLDGWSGAIDLARAVPSATPERRLPGRDSRGVIMDGNL